MEAIREFEAKRDVRYTKLVNASDYARKKDGVGRYRIDGNDIAISKDGDSYSIYDYGTKTISKDLSESELRAALSEYDTKRDTAKTAEKEKSASKEDARKPNSKISGRTFTENELRKNAEAVLKMKSVAELSGKEFSAEETGTLKEKVVRLFESHGNSVINEELGAVSLTASSFHDDRGHGLTRNKIISFAAIPAAIKNGKAIDVYQPEGSTYERITLAAPIEIEGKKFYIGVMIQRDLQSQRMYLHDVVEDVITEEVPPSFTNVASQSNDAVLRDGKHLYITSILKNALNVNKISEKTSENPSGKSVIAEINEYARKHVVGFDKLNAANKAVIRRIIRQGRARGVKESVLIDYANVAARAKIDVVFDKALTAQLAKSKDGEFVAYADAYYDPRNYRIVANPEVQTSDGVLIHELDHALRKSIKGGRVTTKLYGDAIRAVDADKYQEIHNAYAKGKKMSLADKITLTEDEVEAHYARTALEDKGIVHHLVAKQPSVKDKILSFFKKASGDYIGAPNLQKQAMRYYKQYRKWFNEFAKERAFAVMGDATTKVDKGDLRYAIVALEDGKTYVEATRNIITGTTRAEQRKEITAFFRALLESKPSLEIHTIEGDVLTLTMAETATKARDDYKQVDGKRVKLTDDEFALKSRIASHIDEISEVSQKRGNQSDNKGHAFASDGFTYRRAYFKDFDGKYYEVTLSIGHNGTVATVYSVGKIEKSVSSSAKIIAVVESKLRDETLSSNIIYNSEQKSNPSDENSSKKSSNFDVEYLAAVENGDMKTAQRMVDEAAKKAGYDSPKVYHGSSEKFTEFSYDKIGSSTGVSILGDGFYFTDEKKLGEGYGGRLYEAYLKLHNPYIAISDEAYKLNALELSKKGYDGVTLETPKGKIYMVFDNTQIKSADPVTYDDSGNVIPLSKRFDPQNPDIRYSLPLTDAKGNAVEYGDQSRYSYESLTGKGDLAAVKLPSELPMTPEGKIDNKAVVARGRLNARKQKNPNNTDTDTYVRVDDIGVDVLIGAKGLQHGLARSKETAFAVMKIGDVLKNSIAVNELNSSETRKSEMSYVLLGACRDNENLYAVRSVVSKLKNDVTEIDVYQLGAVKGKKTEIPNSALKRGAAVTEQSSLISSGSPTVSIADFLEYVKNIPLINEVFSLDVTETLGVDRTNGTLSDDLRFSLPLTDDKGNPIEYEDVDIYTEKQYNNFGWARHSEALTKNELDDLYSKLQEKKILRRFKQSAQGEAIVEVNDKPHTTLGVDNVFVFVKGKATEPKITRVVRFRAETEIEMEIIKEALYERGTCSDTYLALYQKEEIAREYRRENSPTFDEYRKRREDRETRRGADRDHRTGAERGGDSRSSKDDVSFSLPLTDDKGNPIEYEDVINKGVPYAKSPDMTVGQMRKHIANTTHYKVFSKSQILEDVKKMPMGDLLKAETREQIAEEAT